mmetsp:Transcript_7467/g.20721  ORF Transcript_7467/g.20721 Transcript_7467/m.20721 type:complete len:253 (-) Transcript_7467:1120-1878(-)
MAMVEETPVRGLRPLPVCAVHHRIGVPIASAAPCRRRCVHKRAMARALPLLLLLLCEESTEGGVGALHVGAPVVQERTPALWPHHRRGSLDVAGVPEAAVGARALEPAQHLRADDTRPAVAQRGGHKLCLGVVGRVYKRGDVDLRDVHVTAHHPDVPVLLEPHCTMLGPIAPQQAHHVGLVHRARAVGRAGEAAAIAFEPPVLVGQEGVGAAGQRLHVPQHLLPLQRAVAHGRKNQQLPRQGPSIALCKVPR